MSAELKPAAPLKGDELLLAARLDGKTYKRLRHYSREEAVARMAKVVTQAMMYRGQGAKEDTVTFTASALVDELARGDFGLDTITFEEIGEVVRRAALQETDFFVSVSSLYRVLLAYAKGAGHQMQRKAEEITREKDAREMRDSVVGAMIGASTQRLARKFTEGAK